MLEDIKKDAASRMGKCVETFQADLKKLRTGRAHPSLIETLKVDYYGTDTPLKQVANISVEDARTLGIARVFALTMQVEFFGKVGFEPTLVSEFPEKIAADCAGCSRRDHCVEVAVARAV